MPADSGRRRQILVQDEASSVVWGMPGFVARPASPIRVPLSRMADEIVARFCVRAVPCAAI